MCFPCKLKYIYSYQKVAIYRLDNVKSFYKHKNVYKEIVCLETRTYCSEKKKFFVVSLSIKHPFLG